MKFKLIIAFVRDERTQVIVDAVREAGATGSTIINQARGEGVNVTKTFLGLNLETQRDMLIFLVEEHLCRHILEKIEEIGEFESRPGAGIAFQIDVEDAVGVSSQIDEISKSK